MRTPKSSSYPITGVRSGITSVGIIEYPREPLIVVLTQIGIRGFCKT